MKRLLQNNARPDRLVEHVHGETEHNEAECHWEAVEDAPSQPPRHAVLRLGSGRRLLETVFDVRQVCPPASARVGVQVVRWGLRGLLCKPPWGERISS